MYKVGDKVVHQREGACVITNMIDMEMNDVKRQYYVLEPVIDKKSNVYISIQMNCQGSIRPAIEDAELSMPQCSQAVWDSKWISDSKERYRTYGKCISTFEFHEVLDIFICLTLQKKEKDLASKDSELMLSAEKLVCSEMALLLNDSYDNVLRSLREQILAAA